MNFEDRRLRTGLLRACAQPLWPSKTPKNVKRNVGENAAIYKETSSSLGVYFWINKNCDHLRREQQHQHDIFQNPSSRQLAASLSLPQFFTRGCHNKVYLGRACPSLLSAVEQIRLRDKGPTLDTKVKKEMVDILGRELARYVEGLYESKRRHHQLRRIVPTPLTKLHWKNDSVLWLY